MEHRWSVRTPITTEVNIHHNNRAVALGSVSDIGLGGMFVKTEPLAYPRNTILEVEIELDTDEGCKRFRLASCIVYHAKTGLGLMFLKSNSVVSRSIRKIMLDGAHHQQISRHDNDLMPSPAMA